MTKKAHEFPSRLCTFHTTFDKFQVSDALDSFCTDRYLHICQYISPNEKVECSCLKYDNDADHASWFGFSPPDICYKTLLIWMLFVVILILHCLWSQKNIPTKIASRYTAHFNNSISLPSSSAWYHYVHRWWQKAIILASGAESTSPY